MSAVGISHAFKVTPAGSKRTFGEAMLEIRTFPTNIYLFSYAARHSLAFHVLHYLYPRSLKREYLTQREIFTRYIFQKEIIIRHFQMPKHQYNTQLLKLPSFQTISPTTLLALPLVSVLSQQALHFLPFTL